MVHSRFDMMEKVKTQEVDRISDLPELVLYHILSFLSFKEVVQTCVLSKKWEKVWHSCPVLEFDRNLFGPDLQDHCRLEDRLVNSVKKRRELFNCLERTLHCRDMTGIKRLTIDVDLYRDPKFVEFVDRCVSRALECNVKELIFKIEPFGYRFYVPKIVLSARSVNVLELKGCDISRGSMLNLSSLRKLSLFRVNVDNHVIRNLPGGCPLIEELSFRECLRFTSLELFGLDRLINLSIILNYELVKVDTKAPNLRSLKITYKPEAPFEINVAYCENIKKLSLCGISIEDEWLQYLISKLPFLEFLELGGCDDLKIVKILCPSLKSLLIRDCRGLVELKIDTPNLSVFQYFGDMISFSSNALALLNMYIALNPTKFHNQQTSNYMELNAQFHHFPETLRIELKTGEDVIVQEELR